MEDLENDQNPGGLDEVPSMVSDDKVEDDGVPVVGMKLNSEEEAYNLYNNYAVRVGFSIRKSKVVKDTHGALRQRYFVCAKEGLRMDDDGSRVRKVKRSETRTNCKASIRFMVKDGIWEVTFFNPEHNHELAHLEQRKFLRSNRKIPNSSADMIKNMVKAGMRPMQAYSFYTEQVGGIHNAKITPRDCYNLLRTKRLSMIKGGDAQAVFDHFKHKQGSDPMFFYSVKLDDEGRLMNFFWRDGRSKMDYDLLGDVVTLDTTFRINKYNMVCAPFVGVNHHRKDNYFGCAFLSNETTASFSWLFETFLESMGNKKPTIIFTDQDATITNAVKHAFPDTCHLLCIWQIARNAAKIFSNYYADTNFRRLFDKCLKGCLTETEFESTWNTMINGFNLKDNKWFSTLYDLRQKWCPTFSLHTTSAGVRCTQKSESVNNVFKSTSSETMNIIQFVQDYEEAAERQRSIESEQDFGCNQRLPSRVSTSSGLLNQAANVYTAEIYELFQKEMVESLSVVMEEVGNDGILYDYQLCHEDRSMEHKVLFNTYDSTIKCTCKMFESMGLLCRHVLRVLNLKGITKVPPQYILKRWTKYAKQWVALWNYGDLPCNNTEVSPASDRLRLMQKAFYVIERSLTLDGGSKIVDAFFDQILDEVEKLTVASQLEEHDQAISISADNDSNDEHSSLDQSPLLDPPIVMQNCATAGTLEGELENSLKRKALGSTMPYGKEKKHMPTSWSPIASSTQLPNPTIICPSFSTNSMCMDATSFQSTLQLHQFSVSTIGDSNSQFANMLPGSNPVAHENQSAQAPPPP